MSFLNAVFGPSSQAVAETDKYVKNVSDNSSSVRILSVALGILSGVALVATQDVRYGLGVAAGVVMYTLANVGDQHARNVANLALRQNRY